MIITTIVQGIIQPIIRRVTKTPYMGPNFDGTSSRYLEIPPWRPTGFNLGDNLIRFKCRIDTIKGSGGIMTSNAGGTPGAVWQSGGNFTSRHISSLTVNGGTDYTINTGEEVVIEGRLDTSFGSIADVGITTFMNLSYATTYESHGDIWDIELIDNLDPSNSRTYAVRKYQADGDLTLTNVAASVDSAVISESWDDFTIVGNNITIANGVLNCTGTTTNAVQVSLDTRSLANDIDLVVQFDVDAYSGADCQLYVYREGAGDVNLPFGAADVGTTKTLRYTGGSEYNVANQITIFQNPASGSTFTLSNLRIWQEVDGTLVNFPTEAWEIISDTQNTNSDGLGNGFDITVGTSPTHIGFWQDRSLGQCTDPTITRLSVTVSNGVMFFDCDPVETQQNITLRFSAGDVLMSLSSGRYTSNAVPPAVRALFDIDGNVVPVEIIR